MIKHSRIKIIIAILMVLVVGTLFTPPLSAGTNGSCYYQFLPSSYLTQSDIKAVFKVWCDGAFLPKSLDIDFLTPQGTTTGCFREGGGWRCNYDNVYSGDGSWISTSTEFYISGQQRPSGTYTVVGSYCTSYVGSACITYTEWFSDHFYISDVPITYTLSGNAGVAGATLSYVDGTPKTAAADGAGNYTFTVSSGWSGTVTPAKTGYTFAPASRTYANVLADQTVQNYTASAVTYTISGNAGVAGATLSYVDGTPKTAAADGTGNYTIAVPFGWSGTVTPAKTSYSFTPASRTYTNVLADQTAQNYTATAMANRIYLPLVIR